MSKFMSKDAPQDVLNEVPEVFKSPLGKVPAADQVLDVHVKLLDVLSSVKNTFDVVLLLIVINFVLTI